MTKYWSVKALERKTAAIVIDVMILAEDRPSENVLFITENLAMNKQNLVKFAKIARERLPDRKIEFLKRGKHKQHDTIKFYDKLKV